MRSKKARPFSGVCTVASKLFNIVLPDRAYFGEKDAQQLAIIRRMVKDLNFGTEIVSCPIVREPDGLAMSSRDLYLSPEERKAALSLSRSLNEAKQLMAKDEKDPAKIREMIAGNISVEPLARVDYVEIVDSATRRPVQRIEWSVLAAVAVYIGKTRLTDNFTFKGETK